MKGKDKCEFLRGIRKRMAEANGIPYEPRECTYEGDCTGTCPFCEKEAAELMAKIKEKGGDVVKTDTESIATFEEVRKMYDDYKDYMGSLVNSDIDHEDEYPKIEEIKQMQEKPLRGDVRTPEELRRIEERERLRREEEYRKEIEKREKRDKGFLNKVINRIKSFFEPTLMGEVEI